MTKIGNPFQQGTPASLALGVALTLLLTYFYVTSPEKEPFYLIPIFFGIAGTSRAYFKYRKLKRQNGIELIGDSE